MKYKYPFTRKQAMKCVIYCFIILLLFLCLIISSNNNRVYVQFYAYMILIGFFAHKCIFFQKKLKEKIYISLNAIKCLKVFELLIMILAGMVAVGFFISIVDRRAWDEYLLLWQFGLLFIFYFIALFYPCIVVFGKKSYISGSFEMSYEEIIKIVNIKAYDIMGNEMIKCEILTRDGKKCMEKFTVDEYNFLYSLCATGDRHD